MAIYPFVEAWITGDKREHHMADRPRNAPTRTAIGAAGVTFYAGMWAAASSDLIATHFRLSIEGVTLGIQIVTVLGPFVAYFVAKRICIGLQKKDREIALHGYESGRIVRLPGGEYVEVHEQLVGLRPLEARQLRRLQAADDPPEQAGPDHGHPARPRGALAAGSSRTGSPRSRRARSRPRTATTTDAERS